MKNFFKTQVLTDPYQTANRLAMDFIRFAENTLQYREQIYIALSGGSTPQLLFDIIAKEYAGALDWKKLHFFWVDERCVSADNPESNYGNAFRILFSKIDIPKENLHPVHGGEDPINEVVRYTGEILSFVPCIHNLPVFDLILLGMGNDGHTASIFPGQMDLFETNAICSISRHPETKQCRITLTGKVINNGANLIFLITGSNKADILKSVIAGNENPFLFPAKNIKPQNGTLSWYIDNEAASLIDIKQIF